MKGFPIGELVIVGLPIFKVFFVQIIYLIVVFYIGALIILIVAFILPYPNIILEIS